MDHVIGRLRGQAESRPDAAAYFTCRDGAWEPVSWSAYHAEVRRAARALLGAGFRPGDTAAVIGWNQPQWSTWALAAMAAGGAPVGIYATNAPSELAYVVRHAGARFLLVENEEQWSKVVAARAEMGDLLLVVTMEDEAPAGTPVLSWSDFLAEGERVPEERLDERIAALDGATLASLIYTSGTTGRPKGVMLSHSNLIATSEIALELFDLHGDDRNLSYLPLSHIAEQMFTVVVPTLTGMAVYYAEAPSKVVENLQEVQPTLVFGVPRVWEKMHAAVAARLAEASGLKASLARWALAVGREVSARRNRGEEPGGWLALRHRIADRLVASKVRRRLGLGSARYCISGAAPIAAEVLEFFAGLGVVIHEVYGQSEGTGPTSWNRPGRTRFGTVGPPLPRVEVRIADDGEVLVRGPNVFQGYYREPEATAEALVDGWLHSGDLGRFDDDGFLVITGRKKDILITSGGKNIAPRAIEEQLLKLPLVGEAMAVGDGRRYVTALLTLDPEAAAQAAARLDVPPEQVHTAPEVLDELRRGIEERVNVELARVEQVRAFRVLARPFSTDHGELTPTMKLKRNVVEQRYAREIEEMYAG
ncbi:MAG: long-chain fatty acid--CoA ligase [Thermoanaerobaculia bacterium]